MSHAELDEAEELDEGDPAELGAELRRAARAPAQRERARRLLRHRRAPRRRGRARPGTSSASAENPPRERRQVAGDRVRADPRRALVREDVRRERREQRVDAAPVRRPAPAASSSAPTWSAPRAVCAGRSSGARRSRPPAPGGRGARAARPSRRRTRRAARRAARPVRAAARRAAADPGARARARRAARARSTRHPDSGGTAWPCRRRPFSPPAPSSPGHRPRPRTAAPPRRARARGCARRRRARAAEGPAGVSRSPI